MISLRALVLPTLLLCVNLIFPSSAVGADGPPVLTVLAPLNHTVTRSASVYVEAVATDDVSANCTINVYDGQIYFGDLKLSGTNSVKGHVSSSGTLVFQAIDSTGHETVIVRKFLIEPNSNLVEVATAPGLILDFTADHFLCAINRDPGGFDGVTAKLGDTDAVIVDRHTGAQTVISDIGGNRKNPRMGVLSGNGVFVEFAGAVGTWNSGLWTDYGAASFIKLAGRFVLYHTGPPAQLLLRDIDNPTGRYAITNNNCCSSFTVAANGDILLASDFAIYRLRPADPANPFGPHTFTVLTYNGAGPLTDGTNVVSWMPGGGIGLLTPTGQEVLSTSAGEGYYLINNGWVAFAQTETGQRRLWVRSPSGQIEQRVFAGGSNALESLGPDGSFTYYNDFPLEGDRHLSRPGSPPWNIGSLQGIPKWVPSGELRIMLGRSLFAVRSGHFRALHQTHHPFVAEFSSAPGHHLEVQSSSNLVDWLPVTTFSNISGSVLFTNDSSAPRQFFRTRLLP